MRHWKRSRASPTRTPTPPGWSCLRPDDWDSVKPTLTPGTEVAGPYEIKMDEDGFAGCA